MESVHGIHAQRFRRTCAAAAVPLLTAGGVLTGQFAYAKTPEPAGTAGQEPPKVVALPVRVGVKDALSSISKSNTTVLELRFSGNGIVGGLMPVAGTTAQDQATWVELAFQRRKYFRLPACVDPDGQRRALQCALTFSSPEGPGGSAVNAYAQERWGRTTQNA